MTCTCKTNVACSECPPQITDLFDTQAKLVAHLQLRVQDATDARDARELSVALGVAADKLLALRRELDTKRTLGQPVVWNQTTTGTS